MSDSTSENYITFSLVSYTDIYVKFDSQTVSTYYSFYQSDSASTAISNFEIDISKKYRFLRKNDETAHPFYISDVGYEQQSTSAITITGDGAYNDGIEGSESVIVSFNSWKPDTDTLYFYCTSHSNMISSFTIPTEAKLRKVKLYQARNNDGSPLNIAEIQVWVNNTNVASSSYNSNNSASSNNIHGSFPASNLIDNNLNNFAHTSSNSSINDDLIVTLSQNYDLSTIQSVVIYNEMVTETIS